MLKDVEASANESGNKTMMYKNDEVYDCSKPWQSTIAENFINENLAIEVKVDAPAETKKTTKKKVTKKKTTKKKG